MIKINQLKLDINHSEEDIKKRIIKLLKISKFKKLTTVSISPMLR